MKDLTQDVFNNVPKWVKSAEVTHTNIAWGFNLNLSELKAWRARKGSIEEVDFIILGFNYKNRFWNKTKLDRV